MSGTGGGISYRCHRGKTDLLAPARKYAEQGLCNGRVSVRPSVCPFVSLSVCPSMGAQQQTLQVCCCGPGGQEILIDCCAAGAQQRRRANAGSATLSAYIRCWTAQNIGADFRFEVPGQSPVGLIGSGRGQWLGGHHGHGQCGAQAYNGGLGAQPPAGSRGRAPGQGVRGAKPP